MFLSVVEIAQSGWLLLYLYLLVQRPGKDLLQLIGRAFALALASFGGLVDALFFGAVHRLS